MCEKELIFLVSLFHLPWISLSIPHTIVCLCSKALNTIIRRVFGLFFFKNAVWNQISETKSTTKYAIHRSRTQTHTHICTNVRTVHVHSARIKSADLWVRNSVSKTSLTLVRNRNYWTRRKILSIDKSQLTWTGSKWSRLDLVDGFDTYIWRTINRSTQLN